MLIDYGNKHFSNPPHQSDHPSTHNQSHQAHASSDNPSPLFFMHCSPEAWKHVVAVLRQWREGGPRNPLTNKPYTTRDMAQATQLSMLDDAANIGMPGLIQQMQAGAKLQLKQERETMIMMTPDSLIMRYQLPPDVEARVGADMARRRRELLKLLDDQADVAPELEFLPGGGTICADPYELWWTMVSGEWCLVLVWSSVVLGVGCRAESLRGKSESQNG